MSEPTTTSFDVTEPTVEFVELSDCRVRTATWGDGPAEIVLAHDGLGSIPQWRDVPARVAGAAGVAVMAYERPGHGASTPAPTGSWSPDWLHREADRLAELLAATGVNDPLLVGHSDGGSIVLLHAAARRRCRGVIAIAAHSWVEPICTRAIAGMRRHSGSIVNGLRSFHEAPAELFEAWSSIWVSDEFSAWDIRTQLRSITVPTMVAQGDRDEYATDAQLTETAAAVGATTRCERIADAGHSIHHEHPSVVVDLIAEFYDQLRAAPDRQ